MTPRTIAFLFPLVLAGCFLPDIRLKRNVAPSEVVGLWTLTADSFLDIRRDPEAAALPGRHLEYQIDIRADGTLIYRSLLQMPVRQVDVPGRWELRPLSGGKPGNELQIVVDIGGGHGFSLNFTEEKGRLLIWEYFGDPDRFRLVTYEKTA